MANWTHDDLLTLDARLAEEGVALHARPLRAALEILGGDVLTVLANPEAQKITAAYDALFPESSTTWPGFGIGIIASVDRVRKVTLDVLMGNPGP
jgi:hypothetical protein